ncbi:hypothetical protein KY332_00250 [Candidatus Woesearchaeota archaeon]|nr:hypothetical protein [Candidatus Woesearchaeota archaeon]
MKRVAFIDKYIHALALPPFEDCDIGRLQINELLIEELRFKYDLLKYPKFNIHRIRKDYPIDGIITHITPDDSLDEEQELFYKAYPSEIKAAKEEFPKMKILAYTDEHPSLDYVFLMDNGVDDVLWRDHEDYLDELEIICKWVDDLEVGEDA